MIDGGVAHRKNFLSGAFMSHYDFISGEWLAPGRFPRRGEGLGYFQYSPFVGQFAAGNVASANVNFVGYIRSGDYHLGLFHVTLSTT